MSKITYKNLYSLTIEEILKRSQFDTGIKYNNQLSKPITMAGDGRANASTAELVTAIQNLLSAALPPNILSGLVVEETTPISSSVTVALGKGQVGGVLYELETATTINIPFDSSTYIFYLILYKDRILIERTYSSDKLTIAKIVVPKPGVTQYVQNDKDDSWNAYIVNFQEYKLYGYNNKLEEDSIELLRDNISPILADNLIGNIRLSEDLKITNTQGTLELDSAEVRIKSNTGDVLAKFNRNGTFFYDSNGIEVAKFGATEARVGNIKITSNSVQSGNFVSGALGSGFQILDSGDAEFNNILARGKLVSSVFEKDTVSSVGGNLLISDSDILDVDMTTLDSSTLTIIGDTTFANGDILRIKDGVDDEWLEVTNITSAPTYTVTRDKASIYIADGNPTWKKGTAVINYGSSGDGLLYLTASESNSPYISVATHTGSPWSILTTRVRMGNLNGFLNYVTDLYGIGIGETNSYLTYDPTNGLMIKGSITVTGGGWSHVGDLTKIDGGDIYASSITADKITVSSLSALSADLGTITAGTVTGATLQTALSGSRIVMTTSSLTAYDENGNVVFLIDLEGPSGALSNIGDVIIGDYLNNKGLKWDASESIFRVRGDITATSGTFTGTVNVGSLGNVIIDGSNERILIYDDSSFSNLLVELGKLL